MEGWERGMVGRMSEMQREVLRTECEGGNWIGEKKGVSDVSSGDQILCSVRGCDSKLHKELTETL